jgi:hypothetical protein
MHKWRHRNTESSSDPLSLAENVLSIEGRLKWLLLENPCANDADPIGYSLHDGEGAIRGIEVCFPGVFVAGDKRIRGLCSGSFFVEQSARSMGFYLFRKYLSIPGYSFFYATTCNPTTAALWSGIGARAVPQSNIEYFLPLRLDPLIRSRVPGATSGRVVAAVAGMVERCAKPILQFVTRPSQRLEVEPSADWEKLAALAKRDQSGKYIAADRSEAFLRWRYGPGSPLHPGSIHIVRDKQGNEGWFALGNVVRGERAQIRATVVLDAIWPRERMDYNDIFQQIVSIAAAAGSDAVFFQPQPGLDYRHYSRWVMTRRFPAPRAFVRMSRTAPPLALDPLDYHDNDFGAWAFRWPAAADLPALVSHTPSRVAAIGPNLQHSLLKDRE